MGRVKNWGQIQELNFESFILGKFWLLIEMTSQFVSVTSTRIVYFIYKIMHDVRSLLIQLENDYFELSSTNIILLAPV